jgi:hypothetical protein
LGHSLFCNVNKYFVPQCNKMKRSASKMWIAGIFDPLLCEQQRMDWIWVPWNLDPPFIYTQVPGLFSTCLQPKQDWGGGRHNSCPYTWIAGLVDPFICEQQKNGLDLSTLEFGPPFHLPKLVDFSAHANSQNKMKFYAMLKNCFVLQCNKMKFSVPKTWIAELVDLLLCVQKRIDWIWVPWNLDPPLYLPKLVGFSVHAITAKQRLPPT